MVENVNEHNSIDAALTMRKTPPIESLNWQPGPVSNQDVHSLDVKVGTLVEDRSRQFSVTTTDLQKITARRYQLREKLRKPADASAVDIGFVEMAEYTHLRPTPIMLKKKLAKMISTPKVVETSTAATRRTITTGSIDPNPA